MSYDLQNIPLDANRSHDQDLYFKIAGSPGVGHPDGIELKENTILTTDTYFGIFPFGAWLELCGIDRFKIHVEFQGDLIVRLKTFSEDRADDETVGTWSIAHASGPMKWCSDPIAFSIKGGHKVLYIELEAVEDSRLQKLGYATDLVPVRFVDFGIAITTFRRTKEVRASVERLSQLVVNDPEPELGRFRLTVVDNGNDLDSNEFANVSVLPNPNLGGAGGFARGLSHYQEHTTATHCCFMDDDASTEIECLLRTRRVLAYAKTSNISVSAAMLRSERSFMMHEQGAIFEWGRKHRIISRKNGLDLRKRSSLLEILRPEPIGYGGFWYLAFPIREEVIYPYPLFVRGDDWLFSYMNRFQIQVLPGIASWQEGFENKINPTEQYLAFKAFLVAELMLREPVNRLASIDFFTRWIRQNLNGFLYDRAEMNCIALADVIKGPQFWADNVLLGKRLASLKKTTVQETHTPMSAGEKAALAHSSKTPRKSLFLRLFNVLSVKGKVIPNQMLRLLGSKKRTIFGFANAARSVDWNCGEIEYVNVEDGIKFIAKRSNIRYWRLYFMSTFLFYSLFFKYGFLRGRYIEFGGVYCQKSWWDGVIKNSSHDGLPS